MPTYEVYWRAEGSFEVEADSEEDVWELNGAVSDRLYDRASNCDPEICEVIRLDEEDED